MKNPLLILTTCLLVSTAAAQYGGGSGTAEDPYQIRTAEQMNAIGASPGDWDKHFKLMADIDLAAFDGQQGRPAFNIIGTKYENPFTGIFDGSGHTISHLTIKGSGYLGLFGRLKDPAEVKDLGLLDINVTAGSNISSVGGLVGGNGNYLGAQKGGTITDCYSTGVVSGAGPQANYFGGLVGTNYGQVVRCHSTAVVTASWQVGGLLGGNGSFMFPQGVVKYCYSTGTVRANSAVVGGLAGENYGTVTCCYSTGAVSGASSDPWAGGLLGSNHGTIAYCYSTGPVKGTGWYVGGLACWSMGTATACFWDTQTSGQTTSRVGTGKTTAAMQTASTFLAAGWDFVGETNNGTEDIWRIDEGKDYPQLWWSQPAPGKYGGGSGTAEDPYQIRTAEQMNALGASRGDWGKHFRLVADIDLSAFDGKDGRPAFNVIAPVAGGMGAYLWSTPFSGVFDGNDCTISHLTITGENYRALFGYLDSRAEVKNLGLVDVNVTAADGWGYIGALAGYSFALVSHCYSTGVVHGGEYAVGGLVGYNRAKVIQCYSKAEVHGTASVGGLVGENWGTVEACYSTDAVTAAGWSVGGLVGSNYGPVTQCYSAGAVTGAGSDVGGLIGAGGGPLIGNQATASFWDTQTSGQTTSRGGTGKTTAEMQKASTFLAAGWDFGGEITNGTADTWWIDEGKDYPRLQWEAPAAPPAPVADITWLRTFYYDSRYRQGWQGDSTATRSALTAAGYTTLNADELKTWMNARIADKRFSVVVFCQDFVPDTVAETMSSTCTLRRYLDAGGKIVWYAEIPLYNRSDSSGVRTVWDVAGSIAVLGFNAAGAKWDSYNQVTITPLGKTWGLTQTWQSRRPAVPTATPNLEILATDDAGNAAAWVRHYVPNDTFRGFVRLYDRPGQANAQDLMSVAEYPNPKASNPQPRGRTRQ